MMLLTINTRKIRIVANTVYIVTALFSSNLKYTKVGMSIGKTRICDIIDDEPIVNAFPVADMLTITSVLSSRDDPIAIASSMQLLKIIKLNVEEIREIDIPNINQ